MQNQSELYLALSQTLGIGYGLTGPLGIMMNICSAVIISKYLPATSTNQLLKSLACADTLKLLLDVIYFALFVQQLTMGESEESEASGSQLYPSCHYLFKVAQCLVAWLTMALARNRYLLVCWPVYARKRCVVSKERRLTAAAVALAAFVCIPSYFRAQLPATTCDTPHNASAATPLCLALFKFYPPALILLHSVLPILCLVVWNCLTLRAFFMVRHSQVRVRRRRVTINALTIIFLFLACAIADTVCELMLLVNDHLPDIDIAREIGDFLLHLNSVFNFFTYAAVNAEFQTAFSSICTTTRKTVAQIKATKSKPTVQL